MTFQINSSAATLVTPNGAYTATFTANGANGAITWSFAGLPSGFTGAVVNSTSASISCAPGGNTAVGSYSVIVVGVDSAGIAANYAYTLFVAKPLGITGSLPHVVNAVPFSAKFYPVDGLPPYTYNFSGNTLPTGLTISGSTGITKGTPTNPTTKTNLIFKITDAAGQIANTSALTLTADPVGTAEPLTINAQDAANGTVSVTYTAVVAAGGGSTPYTYSIASGALPNGITLSPTSGVISGAAQANQAGTYSIVARVTDSLGATADVPYGPFTINASNNHFAIGTITNINTIVGTTINSAITYGSNTGPVTFDVITGILPPGLAFGSGANTGHIMGIPSTAGAYPYQVRGTDSTGTFDTTLPGTINVAILVTTPANTIVTPTANISLTINCTGHTGNVFWEFYSLPSDVEAVIVDDHTVNLVSNTGSHTAGDYNIVVKVTDSLGHTGTKSFHLFITTPLTGATVLLANGAANTYYSGRVVPVGGLAPYTFSIASGTIPTGFSLKSGTGIVWGSTTTTGTKTAVIKIVDVAGQTVNTASFSINIAAAGTTIPETLYAFEYRPGYDWDDILTGVPYSYQFFPGGGVNSNVSSFTFTIVSGGALPTGLALSNSGFVSGSAFSNTVGNYGPYTFRATDNTTGANTDIVWGPINVLAASHPPSITDCPDPLTPSLGHYFEQGFEANSVGTTTMTLSSGTLPPNTTFVGTGNTAKISGTPNTVGSWSGLVVTATDANSRSVSSQPFTITVGDLSPMSLDWSPTTSWTNGDHLTANVTTTGGEGTITYGYTGTLPPGVTQNTLTGSLDGILTANGTFGPITVTATDGLRNASTSAKTFTVISGLSLTGSLANGVVGSAYSAQFTANGGAGSYVYAVSTGTLPAGLSLGSANGTVSGTPNTAGTYSGIRIKATDAANNVATVGPFTVTITATLAISGSAPASAPLGQPYVANFTASGGTGTKTFSLVGTLPSGLSLGSSNGSITGTPDTAGVSSGIQIVVSDTGGHTAQTAPFSIVAADGMYATVSPDPLPTYVPYGSNFEWTFTGHGGIEPYRYELHFFPVGAGLDTSQYTFSNTTGVLTGNITSYSGQAFITVTLYDSANTPPVNSADFTVEFGLPPHFSSIPPLATIAMVGRSYSFDLNLSTTDGVAPYTYQLLGYSLPAGLVLNGNTGIVSGTPNTAGVTPLRIYGEDANHVNFNTPDEFNFTVLPELVITGSPANTANVGDAYSAQFTANGGSGTGYVFSLASGTLPHGITLSSNGLLAGTPDVPGTYSGLAVTVTDSYGFTATSNTFQIFVDGTMLIMGSAPTHVIAGDPYSAQFTTAGGVGSKTFSLVGTWPTGIAIGSSNGTISGSTNAIGVYANIAVQAQDANGQIATSTPFTLTVVSSLSISANVQATSSIGQNYVGHFTAAGGSTEGFVFTLISGDVPPGLLLSANGLLNGSPLVAGDYTFKVRVTDSAAHTAQTAPVSIHINERLVVVGDPQTVVIGNTTPYFSQFGALGGTSPYVYTISGTYPAGLAFDGNTGILSAPYLPDSSDGLYPNLRVRVTDADGTTANGVAFTIFVGQEAPVSNAHAVHVPAPAGAPIPAQTIDPTIPAHISTFIESQFPEVYRELGATFVEFVRQYYRWAETEGFLKDGRQFLTNQDIDTASEDYLVYFRDKFLPDIQLDTNTNTRLLVKHSLDLYRARGTPLADDLLFRLVFGASADIYFPEKDLFRLSDGEWRKPIYLELTLDDDLNRFVGKEIEGLNSGARAFVESAVRHKSGHRLIDVVYLSAVIGTFQVGELINTVAKPYPTKTLPSVSGSLASLQVVDGSYGFKVGDIVSLSSMGGRGGTARVTSVANTTGVIDFHLVDGGYAYTANSEVIVSNTVFSLANVFGPVGLYNELIADKTWTEANVVADNGVLTISDGVTSHSYYANADAFPNSQGIAFQISMDFYPRLTAFVTADHLAIASANADVPVSWSYTGDSGRSDPFGFNFSGPSGDPQHYFSMFDRVEQITARLDYYNANGAVYTRGNYITSGDLFAVILSDHKTDANSGFLTLTSFGGFEGTGIVGNTFNYSLTSQDANVSSFTINKATANVIAEGTSASIFVSNVTANNFVVGEIVHQTIPETYDLSTPAYLAGTTTANVSGTGSFTVTIYDVDGSSTTVNAAAWSNNQTASDYANTFNGFAANTDNWSAPWTGRVLAAVDGDGFFTLRGADSNTSFSVSNTVPFGLASDRRVEPNILIYTRDREQANGILASIQTQGQETILNLVGTMGCFTRFDDFANVRKVSGLTSRAVADVEEITFEIGVKNVVGTFIADELARCYGTKSGATFAIDLISRGEGAGFEVGSLTDSETFDVNTDTIASYLGGTLAANIGLPANTSANLSSGINASLSFDTTEIGKISYINGINPGNSYSAIPFIRVYEPATYGLIKKGWVVEIDNAGGEYQVGEIVSQYTTGGDLQCRGQVLEGSNSSVLYLDRLSAIAEWDLASGMPIVGEFSGQEGFPTLSWRDDRPRSFDIQHQYDGYNADVDANVTINNGSVRTLDVVTSGYGYFENELVQFTSADGTRSGTALVHLGGMGVGAGYYSTAGGFLSDIKKIYDGDYWQHFSYEIRSSVPLAKYSEMLKKILHVAGTKPFAAFYSQSKGNVPVSIRSATITSSNT